VRMSRRFEKALLIGLDCAVPGRWRKYAEAGLLPAGQRLLADGCFAAECLPTMPTLTTRTGRRSPPARGRARTA